ncbi:MAG: 4-phosphopantetheinyl transferase [Paucimonas sp.]|nr:4-phosphopantetheinyl transferase [Paucimonas sp.]
MPAFNLSHSRDVLAIAICSAGEVGIDVEQLDSNVIADMTSIAQDYFSSEEQRLLAAVPAAQLAEEFFRIWTLKEAVLKAAGVGLFHPLSSLCVAQKAARHALSLELDVGSTIMHAEHRTLPGDVHLAVARADSMSDISVFMHTRVN